MRQKSANHLRNFVFGLSTFAHTQAHCQSLTRKLYRQGAEGWVYWAGVLHDLIEEMTTMKRELDFALNFAMSVLLLAGSIAVAQNTTTTATKKKPSATASTVGASSAQSGTTTSTQTDATSQASGTAPVAAQDQATATAKPKTMVSKDKRTIPVPQL